MTSPAVSDDGRCGFRAAASIRFTVRRAAATSVTVVAFVAASAAGCSSVPDGAVPGCPVCGDPVTHVGADGHGRVVARMRLRDDGAAAIHAALGLFPWALERTGEGGAAGEWPAER